MAKVDLRNRKTINNESHRKLIKELFPQEALGLDNFLDYVFLTFKEEVIFLLQNCLWIEENTAAKLTFQSSTLILKPNKKEKNTSPT